MAFGKILTLVFTIGIFTAIESGKYIRPKGLTAKDVKERLRHIQSIEEFEETFNINNNPIKKRGNLFSNLLSSIPRALGKPRPCVPQETCSLIPHDPVSEQYVPACLNVTRCGGCCGTATKSSEMECVPDKISTKSIRVMHIDKFQLTYAEKVVQYEDHKSCKCQCKMQPKHCTKNQKYNPTFCQCFCDVQKPCPPKMQWSNLHCGCQCTAPSDQCSSSHVWNENTCKCDCRRRACNNGETFSDVLCQCLKPSNQVVVPGQ